jgi:hypothetical protein
MRKAIIQNQLVMRTCAGPLQESNAMNANTKLKLTAAAALVAVQILGLPVASAETFNLKIAQILVWVMNFRFF